ncbi:hypothetical protein [Streptomyces boninensis]|uniref:hypothetical protein n=1 Tax=Streptomyces boninensis TaxID=2039455 RepID=UPI003B22725F
MSEGICQTKTVWLGPRAVDLLAFGADVVAVAYAADSDRDWDVKLTRLYLALGGFWVSCSFWVD